MLTKAEALTRLDRFDVPPGLVEEITRRRAGKVVVLTDAERATRAEVARAIVVRAIDALGSGTDQARDQPPRAGAQLQAPGQPGDRRATDRPGPALARFGVAVDGTPLDLTALFGRSAPVVLENGSGWVGDRGDGGRGPGHDVLAVDVHTPGQGNLLRLLEQAGLTNVRVADGDARQLLTDMLAPAGLAGVRLFFPDPWPKSRHVKRRLLDDGFAALVADRLADGGVLHVATDVPACSPGRPPRCWPRCR